MTPRALVLAAAFAWVGRLAAAPQADCSTLSGAQAPDDPRLREWLRRLIHEVARKEGVDPIALEALGMVESELRPMVGRACEIGPFQVMPAWAEVFRLDSVVLLWDPRINAIAAARIYKAAWLRWNPRFAKVGGNRALQAAGWRGHLLDRESFAALAYNWGRAPLQFACVGSSRGDDPRLQRGVCRALQPRPQRKPAARGSHRSARPGVMALLEPYGDHREQVRNGRLEAPVLRLLVDEVH